MADELGPTGLSARNKASAATLGPTGRSNRSEKGAATLGPTGCSRRSQKAWESGKRETVVEPITPGGTEEHLLCGNCGAEHYQRGYMREYRKNKK
jgi:hypothetical protein